MYLGRSDKGATGATAFCASSSWTWRTQPRHILHVGLQCHCMDEGGLFALEATETGRSPTGIGRPMDRGPCRFLRLFHLKLLSDASMCYASLIVGQLRDGNWSWVMGQWVSGSMSQWVNWPVGHWVNWSVGQWSMGQWVSGSWVKCIGASLY